MKHANYAKTFAQAVNRPKPLLAKIRSSVRNVALDLLALRSQDVPKTFLRSLYCHYVFDDQREAFEAQIRALKQMGTFVDTGTFLDIASGGRPLNGRYFHLSFDDGFRNNLTNACPVLKKHKVPCLFFVPSKRIEIDYETTRYYCVETAGYRDAIETLNWDDLRVMVADGFEIGSHTRTHARFSDISTQADILESELLGSKQDLEAKLGISCDYISWPYGRIGDADDVSIAMVREVGYKACFGAFRGSVVPNATDFYRIPRHHFEPQWPIRHVEHFLLGS